MFEIFKRCVFSSAKIEIFKVVENFRITNYEERIMNKESGIQGSMALFIWLVLEPLNSRRRQNGAAIEPINSEEFELFTFYFLLFTSGFVLS